MIRLLSVTLGLTALLACGLVDDADPEPYVTSSSWASCTTSDLGFVEAPDSVFLTVDVLGPVRPTTPPGTVIAEAVLDGSYGVDRVADVSVTVGGVPDGALRVDGLWTCAEIEPEERAVVAVTVADPGVAWTTGEITARAVLYAPHPGWSLERQALLDPLALPDLAPTRYAVAQTSRSATIVYDDTPAEDTGAPGDTGAPAE